MTDSLQTLQAALAPRSIAIVGASENPNKIGGRPLHYLAKHGFRGRVFPINPQRTEIQGHRSYPSLEALPEAPDLAVVVLAGDAAIDAVASCARLGTRVAVVISSGFSEIEDAAGGERERRMVVDARASGMRIVGPNSQGLANFGTGAIASFSTMFIEAEPMDGPVAIISQSGAMTGVPYGLLRSRGIGVRHAHATGNDADVTVSELACAVAQDPDVRLLLLYLEGLKDPWNLARAAAIAADRGLPIVALKSGRTAAGQQAARTHTGALANEDRVVEEFLARNGIERAADMGELVAGAELYLSGAKPRGRRLVAVSNSGATCVMTADAATFAGLELPPLSAPVTDRLGRLLPGFATAKNPVDVTGALLSNSQLLGDVLGTLADDPGADAFLVGIPVAGAGYDVDLFARETAALAAGSGRPVVVAAPQPSVAARFAAAGLPTFAIDAEAIGALARFVRHHERIAARRATDPAPPDADAGDAAAEPRPLNEADSLAVLAAAGVPVVPHRLCRSEADAREAFDALSGAAGAVVVKGCSADVVHKTELGLVEVGVRSADDVARAFRRLHAVLESAGHRFDGVLVAAMARGGRELMIGAHRDPVFGPVLLVGDGGRYVEAMPDTRLLLPPFTAADVAAALAGLRIAPVLAGTRGQPALDRDAVVQAALAVGALMTDPAGGIASVDVNPIIVDRAGHGGLVVDAVVFRHSRRSR